MSRINIVPDFKPQIVKIIDVLAVRPLLPPRPADAHKGTFGHVFIVAGSRGFSGAAKLAALAAGRSGVGLVTVGVPRSLGDIVGAGLLEAMTFMLPATKEETLSREGLDSALEFASTKNAVALGPGLSQHSETAAFVREFAVGCPVPLLIDADGLNCLSGSMGIVAARTADTVLTPHPGEMARLTGLSTKEVQADREGVAARFAASWGCVVVLKGAGTVVAVPNGEVFVNTTGNSGMATGGTGDVLTGLIGGLLAQGMTALDAALLGVYLHGFAGDLAAREMTQSGLIASDIVDHLGNAWRMLEE
ncbi:MAG: NAD(P)H-hydrate dehydratase [Candidatus Hydrogenedentota bacterium]